MPANLNLQYFRNHVKSNMKKLLQKFLNTFGYSLEKKKENPYPDFDDLFWKPYKISQKLTMTSVERMYSLYLACNYVVKNKIEGDIVECGVWKGGSSMMAALTLLNSNDTTRKLFLYDTYEGMSEPTDKDVSFRNEKMKDNWQSVKQDEKVFCYSTLEEVEQNLFSTGYPRENLVFVKGKVEETIPATIPQKISLLRLDTDWYESTYHELKNLFPLLEKGGVLIIDDYGHWKGAREAVDQYFREINLKPLLQRIDYTGRMMIKT